MWEAIKTETEITTDHTDKISIKPHHTLSELRMLTKIKSEKTDKRHGSIDPDKNEIFQCIHRSHALFCFEYTHKRRIKTM